MRRAVLLVTLLQTGTPFMIGSLSEGFRDLEMQLWVYFRIEEIVACAGRRLRRVVVVLSEIQANLVFLLCVEWDGAAGQFSQVLFSSQRG